MRLRTSAWFLIAAMLAAATPFATADNYNQDFETGWTQGSFLAQTNADGWVAYDARIRGFGPGYQLPPQGSLACYLDYLNGDPGPTGAPYIQTPALTNGVGPLSMYVICKTYTPQEVTIYSSTNGISGWTARATVTNSLTGSWTLESVELNLYGTQYLRIQKTSDPGDAGAYFGIDHIQMGIPPSYVDVTDVALDPTAPYVTQATTVEATITPESGAENLSASVFYSTNAGASFASVSMLEGVSNLYQTAYPGIPSQTVPGLVVDYYIQSVFDSQDSTVRTNFWPQGAPGTATNYTVGWGPFTFGNTNYNTFSLINGLLYQNDAWLNVIGQGSGTPALVSQSPYPNGVGTITVEAKNNFSTNPITFDVEISTNGTSWDITAATFTNTSLGFTEHVVDVDFYESAYVRLIKTGDDSSTYHHLVIDEFSVTEPSSYVDFTGLTLTPAEPLAGSNVQVSVTITPQAGANNIQAKVFYAYGDTNRPFSSSIDLENVGGDMYQGVDPISIPDTPGGTLTLYIKADFLGLNPNTPSTDPVSGVHQYFIGVAPIQSTYTNVIVTGSATTNLMLAEDNFWRGVIDARSGLGSPNSFYFQTESDTWGDALQTSNQTPFFGDAEAGEDIDVLETLNRYVYFSFSDAVSNESYQVSECEYVNFNIDDWSVIPGNALQNTDGWRLYGLVRSDTSSNHTSRALDGKYAIAKYDQVNQYVRSPALPSGVGAISFWYRNWHNDASAAAGFYVETSPSGAPGSWTVVSTVTNILSFDWLYFSLPVGDPSSTYVRVRNASDIETLSWFCLDEIAITEVGSYVTFGTPTNSPSAPIQGDPVTVSVTITPSGGATNLQAEVYYRSGSTAPFSMLSATADGDVFSAEIPPSPQGTIEYYFLCTYDGVDAATTLSPATAPAAVHSFSVSGDLPSSRYQDFDDDPGWTTSRYFSNETYNGWSVSDARVNDGAGPGGVGDPNSEPYKCDLNSPIDSGTPDDIYIQSPVVSNGVGSITFAVMSRFDVYPQAYEIQSMPTGGVSWTTMARYTNSTEFFVTNSLYVNTYQDMSIRISREPIEQGDESGQILVVDDILITYPPSDIYIDEVYHEPAYPAQNEDVTVYCRLNQLNPNYPAFGFEPKVVHRSGSGPWQTNSMSSIGGDMYTGTIPQTEPAQIQYFVRCDFDGVHFEKPGYSESRSPAFSPDAEHTESQPTTFHSYNVRYYRSDYDTVAITGNFETVESVLIGNDWWQGAFYTDPTNQLIIGLNGTGYAENSQQSGTNILWGDSTQWLTTIPTAGTLEQDGSNIVANGSYDGLYLIRFDLRTGDYMILRADWQDFNTWPMHATLFTEGSQGRQAQSWRQTFNDWSLSSDNDHGTMFEGLWTNENYRVYGEWGEDLWVMKNGRIVNTMDHRADLIPTPNTGIIYPSPAKLPDLLGSGSMSFNYRVRDVGTHRTTYASGGNWTNYTVIANITGEGENTDDGSYWSVIYRYQNALNYYEMRVIATNQTQLAMAIYKHSGGTVARLGVPSTAFTGSLKSSASIKVTVQTDGSGKVDHWGYYNGGGWRIRYLDEVSGITGPGTIGFEAYDVNMLVNSVSVSPYGYAESFSSTPTGWTVGGAWLHSQGHYQRVGRYNPGDPVSFAVFTCHKDDIGASHTLWTQHKVFTNVTTLGYVSATVNTQIPEADHLTVIKHLDGTESLRFDDVDVTSWRGEDATYVTNSSAWIMNDGYISGTMPHEGRNLEMRASRGLYTTNHNQTLRSELLETVGPVTFMYRTPAGAPAPEIELRFAPEGTPTLFSTVTNLTLPASEDWVPYSFPLNVESNGFLEIAHTSSDMDARLFLDDVTFFDYHANSTNAWIAYNSLLTGGEEDKLYLVEGQSGYLNYDDDTDTLYGRVFTNAPYIQTPFMPDGVGEISFWYRRWSIPGGLSNGVLVVEKSSDASTWETVTTIEVTADSYTYYSLNQYDPDSHFVRFRNDFSESVPDRVCLDNILVASPIATSLNITNAWTVPEVPLYTNTVKIRAALSDYVLSPSNVQVRAYYHVGTNEWATWDEDINDSLAMILIEEDTNAAPPVYTYETANSIDPVAVDEVVQYVVRADFDGVINAEASSPQRFRDQFVNPAEYEPIDYNDMYGGGNRNPYYVSFSCPTGSVWINELNLLRNASPNFGDREYIELCGRALIDLSGWRVRAVDTSYSQKSNHQIPASTVLGSETNGFGFWVLGDSNVVPAVDMLFTNAPGNFSMHLPTAGGIQLIRPMGAVAHAVSYNTTFGSGGHLMVGYQFIGTDQFFNDSAMAKAGTGSTEGQFTWSVTGQGFTPGAINPFQTLTGNDVAIATSILITDVWNDTTNTWITFLTDPSDRTLTSSETWYSTNLLAPGWSQIVGGGYDGSDGIYTQWFDVMTNSPIMYQIRAEDDQ